MAVKPCNKCLKNVLRERGTDMETCPRYGVHFPDFENNKGSPLLFVMAVFGLLCLNLFIINLYTIVFQKFSDAFVQNGLVKVSDVNKSWLFEDGLSFLAFPEWPIVLMISLVVLAFVCIGLILEVIPESFRRGTWIRPTLIGNLVLFLVATMTMLVLGVQDAMASPATLTTVLGVKVISSGMGLVITGTGIFTGLSTIDAAIAIGPRLSRIGHPVSEVKST